MIEYITNLWREREIGSEKEREKGREEGRREEGGEGEKEKREENPYKTAVFHYSQEQHKGDYHHYTISSVAKKINKD